MPIPDMSSQYPHQQEDMSQEEEPRGRKPQSMVDQEKQDYLDFIVPRLQITGKILQLTEEVIQEQANYISRYIDFLNKYINYQRKVSTLRFERATLIKYVKKLRFLNDFLYTYNADVNMITEPLQKLVRPLGSFFIRYLEIIDLLNYYLTQSLRNETISKTLNQDLVLSQECIAMADKTYRVYVKFVQWFIESSSSVTTGDLTMEIVQFTRKCAVEDGIDLGETDDVLLQEVQLVTSSEEFEDLLEKWQQVLHFQCADLDDTFNDNIRHWSELFDKKKEK
ncbi:AEL307Cp [Eremothecium gossypii ATCC 10895]|uniref:SWI5-dependent HO expression protein 2 n=1 Tax=Eremothecium gossypii (strain ATCC 10895 / CBS 109.51 / FGSC 9923 / NRRL Y-1056) TaxID=284811 RepID=SHE2_EREGS|nr:AEL307Cp [Eremothecium gossypii ATCC 10895]Q758R0.1 RecName: Full=SWI5-dependent HO expression protein 2 [Eremothecium gossypii ATCC 10895]AAS52377.1 AEL307Cp [Eremothecium gossypii ATCC 10895]